MSSKNLTSSSLSITSIAVFNHRLWCGWNYGQYYRFLRAFHVWTVILGVCVLAKWHQSVQLQTIRFSYCLEPAREMVVWDFHKNHWQCSPSLTTVNSLGWWFAAVILFSNCHGMYKTTYTQTVSFRCPSYYLRWLRLLVCFINWQPYAVYFVLTIVWHLSNFDHVTISVEILFVIYGSKLPS